MTKYLYKRNESNSRDLNVMEITPVKFYYYYRNGFSFALLKYLYKNDNLHENTHYSDGHVTENEQYSAGYAFIVPGDYFYYGLSTNAYSYDEIVNSGIKNLFELPLDKVPRVVHGEVAYESKGFNKKVDKIYNMTSLIIKIVKDEGMYYINPTIHKKIFKFKSDKVNNYILTLSDDQAKEYGCYEMVAITEKELDYLTSNYIVGIKDFQQDTLKKIR